MTNLRRFGLVIPKDLKEQLKVLAAKRETTMTSLVLTAVEEYLEREAHPLIYREATDDAWLEKMAVGATQGETRG